MKTSRRFNAPLFMGVPSVLLAFAWLLIWLLWPHELWPESRNTQLRDTRVAYLKLDSGSGGADSDPTLFLLRSAVGFHPPKDGEEQEGLPDMMPAGHVVEPEFLEWRPVAEKSESPYGGTVGSRASGAAGNYVPHRGERTVFDLDREEDLRVFVEMSAELEERELRVPEIPVHEEKGLVEKPWFVTVSLEMDEHGKPVSVFLEKPCEDHEINAGIVRLMYNAMLMKPGKECMGTVSVGYLKH